MLSYIRIHHSKQQARIEELRNENTISNRGKPLTIGIFSDPGDSFNDHYLKNCVDNHNLKSNHYT